MHPLLSSSSLEVLHTLRCKKDGPTPPPLPYASSPCFAPRFTTASACEMVWSTDAPAYASSLLTAALICLHLIESLIRKMHSMLHVLHALRCKEQAKLTGAKGDWACNAHHSIRFAFKVKRCMQYTGGVKKMQPTRFTFAPAYVTPEVLQTLPLFFDACPDGT